MKIHEQRDALVEAVELALRFLPSGPPLGAFGIAREDCALVHIDYAGTVDSVSGVLANALADVRGTTAVEEHKRCGHETTPCDCPSCAGKEEAAAVRERHRAAYTNVKEWVA